jgi:hypothetical protein
MEPNIVILGGRLKSKVPTEFNSQESLCLKLELESNTYTVFTAPSLVEHINNNVEQGKFIMVKGCIKTNGVDNFIYAERVTYL